MSKTNIAVFLFTIGAFAACKKAPSPEPTLPVSAPLPMPSSGLAGIPERPEPIRKLDAMISADEKLAAKNRAEMIVSAPAGFRPEDAARKVRLTLVLEKTSLAAGDEPRFRLELTNAGREPIDYMENDPSVFRWGGLLHSMKSIRFFLVDSKGLRRKMEPALGGRVEPLKSRAGALSRESEAEGVAANTFRVRILPGETLRSLGDGDSPSAPFRTMRLRSEFTRRGKYSIVVELDDRPAPLTEEYVKVASRFRPEAQVRADHAKRAVEALGPVESKPVAVEFK